MPKVKKLPKITTLRNKLDREFNAYIRERDGACILSGVTTELVCSHYYCKRASPCLRWDERNAHAMSKTIHWKHHHGFEPDYALWMFSHYGMKYMKDLQTLAHIKATPLSREYYELKIRHYQTKRKVLNATK